MLNTIATKLVIYIPDPQSGAKWHHVPQLQTANKPKVTPETVDCFSWPVGPLGLAEMVIILVWAECVRQRNEVAIKLGIIFSSSLSLSLSLSAYGDGRQT